MRNSHPNVCSLLGISLFLEYPLLSSPFPLPSPLHTKRLFFSYFPLFPLFSFFPPPLPLFLFLSFSFSLSLFLSPSSSLSFSKSKGVCRNGNQLYICMELMSGNLEKYLKIHSDLISNETNFYCFSDCSWVELAA